MESADYNEETLLSVLSTFECAFQNKESEDVTHFLQYDAIPYERIGTSRTYLMINDDAWANGRIQIDGYYSIALKTIYFKGVSSDELEAAFGDPTKKSSPAYLIGQLARGSTSLKGAGSLYLQDALSQIATVNNIIGGRFVYLDCVPDRRSYYERHGFTFLQQKNKSDLIQMYLIL